MADVNKSVEISYRADLKQLINQLQKMPGVTEQEAKKMVAQLDRQFKRAERSAKKAATAQSKAMKRVKTSADQAAVSVQDLGDQAGDLDRAFMGASQAASLLNPALGEAVMIGSDAAAIFEAITLGLNALNPVFLAIAATVGAAAVAFGGLNAANEKRLDLLSRLREAEEAERDRLSNLANTVTSVADRYTKASEELAAFTGQLNEADLDRIRATREINKATQADVDAMSERIRQSEILVKILSREQTLMADMTEEEKELLKAAQLRFQSVSNSADLEGTTRKSISARLNLTKELTQEIHNEEQIREAIIIRGEQTLDMQNELVELQREFNEEQEKEEKRQERIRSHREAIKNLDQLINDVHEQSLDPIGKAFLQYQKQIDALKEQENLIGKNAERRLGFENAIGLLSSAQSEAVKTATEAQQSTEKTLDDRRLEALEILRERQNKAHNQRIRELEAEKVQQMQAAQTIGSAFDQFAKSNLEFLQESGRATEEQIISAFKLQQASGIAQATINGAVAATRALAELGPVAGPVAATAIAAGVAAQIGIIASQKPPTSHMGGFLAPDEQMRTVLTGEAVLDRATVNRIGGESGVRSLMNAGESDNQVVVIQPFRHVDRYNRSARQMRGRSASRRY